MENTVSFVLDGKIRTLEFGDGQPFGPTTTVLQYLRSLPGHTGVKEGCAEGDCGACTVVIAEPGPGKRLSYRAVDSCLVFLPMLHGKQLITVENLKAPDGSLHPVQQSMVTNYGSQCGFCTPGIIMAMFALYKNSSSPSTAEIEDALTGNLCRCTGYRPIMDAAREACQGNGSDYFTADEERIIGLLQHAAGRSLRLQTSRQIYLRPVSLGEAVTLKHRYPGATVITGATDVALRVTKKHELISEIIDCSGITELKELSVTDDGVTIGAGADLNSVAQSVSTGFPALAGMLEVFGSRQIRSLASLGGSLGTASPIGDMLPVLIALGASIVLEGLNGRRVVECSAYVTGYRKTVRRADELIVAVTIPKIKSGAAIRSYKVSKRKDLDISTVSGGFRLELNDDGRVGLIVLAYGGMAATTKRAGGAEEFLRGKPWTREVVQQAMASVDTDFSPISDARGTAEFRRVAARNLLMKFWSETKAG
jgi:xanthine dehydrogenase small subunit